MKTFKNIVAGFVGILVLIFIVGLLAQPSEENVMLRAEKQNEADAADEFFRQLEQGIDPNIEEIWDNE